MEEIILKALNSKDDYISGEELSLLIGVSRTAIWKHMQELRKKGYVIDSRSKKGYKLMKATENLDRNMIQTKLETAWVGRELLIFSTIDSTNTEGKRRGAEQLLNGTAILSEEQTAGKGRLGRQWISPKYKGLWMSLFFHPENLEPKDGSKMTILAAASVCRAIEKLTGLTVGIKWPNDLVCNKKKVCGILTEMAADPDRIDWLILGIGINVNLEEQDFPEELKETGTSLKIEKQLSADRGFLVENIDRNALAAEIMNQFEKDSEEFFQNGSIHGILEYYNEKVLVKDRELLIQKAGKALPGIGVGVNEEGHLLVRMDNGELQEFFSGEVSVRGVYGYI